LVPEYVDQEELQLGRHHGRQARSGEPTDDVGQGLPRITRIRPPVHVKHPDRQQRRGRIKPGHRHETAFGRHQNTVLVAGFKDQRTVFDVFAPDVEIEHRKRKARAVGKNLRRETCRNAFPPCHPVQIRRSNADRSHLGVLS